MAKPPSDDRYQLRRTVGFLARVAPFSALSEAELEDVAQAILYLLSTPPNITLDELVIRRFEAEPL